MPTTKILDHYRLSLVQDKLLFAVLSEIYKSGIEDESSLEKATNQSLHKIELIISKLYRANLIKTGAEGGWSVTNLAEDLLTRLGVSDIVASSILSELNLDKPDSEFLKACLKKSSSFDRRSSADLSALLKATKFVLHVASKAHKIDKKDKTRVLYALVLGASPGAKEVGIESYCENIALWSSSLHPELEKLFLTSKKRIRKNIRYNCESAIYDYTSSNNVFLAADSDVSDTAHYVAVSRMLANLISKRDVSSLSSIYLLDENAFSRAIPKFESWSPAITEDFEKFYKLHLLESKSKVTENAVKKSLVENLVKYLKSESKDFHIKFNADIPVDEVVSEIAELRSKMSNGELDGLSEKQKRRVVTELGGAFKEAVERFGPS